MIHSLKTKQAYKGITIAAPLVGLFILTACGGSSPAPAEETGLPNIDFMGVIEQPDADTANDGTIADDSMSIMIDDLMDDLTDVTNPDDTSSPGEPVNPIDPVVVIDPVDMTSPGEPGTPVDPIDPIDPVDPVDPTDPGDTTSPGEPGTPVDPVDPVDPTDPAAFTPACESEDCIGAFDWANSFAIPLQTAPIPEILQNQFIQIGLKGSGADTLINADGEPLLTRTLSFNLLDTNAQGGVSSFFLETELQQGYYAGLTADTDVGTALPVPAEDAPVGTLFWKGLIQYNITGESYLTQDFELRVNPTTREISGFIPTEIPNVTEGHANYFKLDGTFDDTGVITGRAEYSAFVNNNPDSLVNDDIYTAGTLSGLIGTNGAVGAFISNNTGDNAGTNPFSGGWIATPTDARASIPTPTEFIIPATPACIGDACVNGADWAGAFNGSLAFQPNPDLPGSQFLQIGENGLDYGVFAGNNSVIQNTGVLRLEDLDGNGTGGVTFFRGLKLPNTHQYFAAVLPDTDLGATLPYPDADEALIVAYWPGRFQVFQQEGLYSARDFNLTVNFAARRIGLFVPAPIGEDYFFKFSMGFDASGAFAGTGLYGKYLNGNPGLPFFDSARTTGYMAGLIGVNGAVGVFASTEASIRPYSGGFVAAPKAVTPVGEIPCDGCVTADNWVNSFANLLPYAPESVNPRNEFLRMGESGNANGLNYGAMADEDVIDGTATLPLTGDGVGSVSFFQGSDALENHYYVALSRDVNVGAPLIRPVVGVELTAIWPGQIQYYNDSTLWEVTDFDLSIDFATRTVGAFVAHLEFSDTYYKLDGSFDDNGVMSGTAVYGTFNENDPEQINDDIFYTPGALTGVIGENGAVGAFISNNDGIGSRPFAGGFVAAPE